MKTPKEKANEIMNKFINSICWYNEDGKYINHLEPYTAAQKAAIICCEEIIEEYSSEILSCCYDYDYDIWENRRDYYINVLEEIKKL